MEVSELNVEQIDVTDTADNIQRNADLRRAELKRILRRRRGYDPFLMFGIDWPKVSPIVLSNAPHETLDAFLIDLENFNRS